LCENCFLRQTPKFSNTKYTTNPPQINIKLKISNKGNDDFFFKCIYKENFILNVDTLKTQNKRCDMKTKDKIKFKRLQNNLMHSSEINGI